LKTPSDIEILIRYYNKSKKERFYEYRSLTAGTVWLFTLQYSAIAKDDAQGERHRLELSDLLPDMAQTAASRERQSNARKLSAIVGEASNFAEELSHAQLYNPAYSREQLLARAGNAESRFEALRSEVNDSKQIIDGYSPEMAILLNDAMENLVGACHFYRSYYYAESTDGEISIERRMKQMANSARDTLGRVAQTIMEYEKR